MRTATFGMRGAFLAQWPMHLIRVCPLTRSDETPWFTCDVPHTPRRTFRHSPRTGAHTTGDTTHVATKIRLKRLGKIRSPHYRIIVIDERAKRDGQAIEEIGLYHPKNEPSLIRVDSERVQYWLGVGAQPTEAVVAILKRTGDWQQFTGDKSPSGVDPQPEPRDREAAFAAALAEDADAAAPAISKAKKKADEEAAKKAAEEEAAKKAADEAAAAKAEEAPAEEAAEEAPAEAAAPAEEA